jgi:hypothetical protein
VAKWGYGWLSGKMEAKLGRWVAKSGRWVATLGRWVAKREDGWLIWGDGWPSLGRWAAKLVAHLRTSCKVILIAQ